MKFIKGFFTAILIIILFPCLFSLTCGYIINTTLLDSHFIISALSTLDISFLLEEILDDQLPAEIPDEVKNIFTGKVNELLDKQLQTIIAPVYDYLLGKSEKLDAVLHLDSIKTELKPLLLEYIVQSQPEEYHAQIKKEFNNYWKEFSAGIPDKIDLGQFAGNSEMYETLKTTKEILSYFKQFMIILTIVTIILFLLIILIQRNIKSLLLISGIMCILLSFIFIPMGMATDYITSHEMIMQEIPPVAYSVIVSLIAAVSTKIRIAGFIYLIAGGFCIIINIMLKRNDTRAKNRENEIEN